MTPEEWFEALTAELLARSPFRRSEYFKRFADGALTREQVWGHIAQHYLLVAWFPRIFSGIHARCDDLEVRKDCARHLLVEDLGYFEEAYDAIVAVPEMVAIIDFFRRLAHEVPKEIDDRRHLGDGDDRV